ncbi:MAG TPA: plastocyanin/azurin family copper-binding protein [Solirubrobacteraceae bacterium]|nr:plastocyanin/azurin family copper-binding protein [Solirubrobacteraceae bacterium]
MRKLLLVPVLAVATLAAAVPAALSARDVTIGDNYFVRPSGVPTVTVSKGTTVRWVWQGRSRHNVKVTQGPRKFGSSTKRTGTYSHKMTVRGTYTLICTVHGASDQKMKLVVK